MEKDISSINDYFKYQKKEWVIKRIFWALMAIFLLYGLLGGLGDSEGILTNKKIELSNCIIEYQKYTRVEKKFDLKIQLKKSDQEFCIISINDDYINKVRIEQIIPEPEEVEIKNSRIYYKIKAEGGGIISFFNMAKRKGKQNLELEVNGHKTKIEHFIFF